jgi:hypothetical protein
MTSMAMKGHYVSYSISGEQSRNRPIQHGEGRLLIKLEVNTILPAVCFFADCHRGLKAAILNRW